MILHSTAGECRGALPAGAPGLHRLLQAVAEQRQQLTGTACSRLHSSMQVVCYTSQPQPHCLMRLQQQRQLGVALQLTGCSQTHTSLWHRCTECLR
jgi:hypothetical protein